MIGVICLTNPFSLIAEYAVKGMFMNFIGSALESVYMFVVMLFWLLAMDKIRKVMLLIIDIIDNRMN